MMPVLECLLLGMTRLKRFIKGAARSEQFTHSGNLAAVFPEPSGLSPDRGVEHVILLLPDS